MVQRLLVIFVKKESRISSIQALIGADLQVTVVINFVGSLLPSLPYAITNIGLLLNISKHLSRPTPLPFITSAAAEMLCW